MIVSFFYGFLDKTVLVFNYIIKIPNMNYKKIFFILTFSTSIFFSFHVNAVEFRGVGSESYTGVKTTKKINTTLEIAKNKACKNAFDKYIQGMEESKRMIFENIQGPIYQNLNEYITCETVVEENIDKKKKKVTVVMKANIDETRLNSEIKKNDYILLHGKNDDIVPIEKMYHAIEQLEPFSNYLGKQIYDDLEHSINEEGLLKGLNFIKERGNNNTYSK